MSQDLIFGFTKKNWSRTPPAIVHECGPDMCTVSYKKEPLTGDEKSKLDRLAQVKMRAESGDRSAQKQWKLISSRLIVLKTKAKGGDPKAKHTVEVLEDSGLFGHVQKISGSLLPSDQDIIERRIQKAGYESGWPVYISTSAYSDYRGRAAKGDKLASEVLSILDRHVKAGHLKIGDEKKADLSRYPIGNADEIAAARDGGSCEMDAMTRTQGVVISDNEIKANMQGVVSLLEGQGSYPHQRRRHHRRHWRNAAGTVPGSTPATSPSPSSTYVPSRDLLKSRIVKRLYNRIKREHIIWMINQDRQNGIWTQATDRYQQAGRAWARSQLQQQQLPTRLTPSGTNPWAQPVAWFQTQAQAVLDATGDQRNTAINTSLQNPANASQPAYAPAPTPAYAPAPASTADAYYPAPGTTAPGTATDDPSLYDDDQQGWPSPLLMHGDFVGDETRAEGENSSSLGDSLPHGEYRALVMNQAIREAGNRKPGTKHLFAAKTKVDRALGASGTSIYIPGAGSRRRTV
jgi:hypothetical protein